MGNFNCLCFLSWFERNDGGTLPSIIYQWWGVAWRTSLKADLLSKLLVFQATPRFWWVLWATSYISYHWTVENRFERRSADRLLYLEAFSNIWACYHVTVMAQALIQCWEGFTVSTSFRTKPPGLSDCEPGEALQRPGGAEQQVMFPGKSDLAKEVAKIRRCFFSRMGQVAKDFQQKKQLRYEDLPKFPFHHLRGFQWFCLLH